MSDYEPYKDALYREKMMLRLEQNRTFIRAFQNNLTDKFFDVIKKTVDPNHQFTQNQIIAISASTGSGKSIVAYSMGMKYFPHFTWRNIYFYEEKLKQELQNFKQNSVLIKDENPDKSIFGLGSNQGKMELAIIAESCRKFGLNLIFIEPKFVENDIVKYYLEPIDMDLNRRITRCAVRDGYTKAYMGYILVDVVAEDEPGWVQYNQIKDQFIGNVMNRNYQGAKPEYEQMAHDIMQHPEFGRYVKKKEQKAFLLTQYPNLTTGQIEVIMTYIGIIERENG